MSQLKGDFWQGYDIQLNSQGKQYYKCKTCNKQWVKNTSQLLSHYNDYALQTLSANIIEIPTPSPKQTFKRQQMTINSFITKMTTTDQKELESLFAYAIYSTECKDIRTVTNYLLNEIQYFCLTTDGWSNINKDPIINYMITILKPIFYKSIPTKEERYSAENIAQGIKLTIEQADVDKFAVVITDNASNIKAA
ncbi:14963_t:CDS:2 [Funneliformis caledonium]|uniref:14963_t:CDS:1 n=1 Tax=Funneliformis caledonium TaxID=1117310 RepID=A0A9N9HHT1_9GLOM|nr:14963_t:CDS:2 [Funneliformis caledonium]